MLGKGVRLAFAGLLLVFCGFISLAGDQVVWTQSGSDFSKGTLIQVELGHHSPSHLRLAGGMTLLWAEQRHLGQSAVAVDVAVDAEDKILVTGHLRESRDGFHTFKLDASGKTLWMRTHKMGRGGQAAGVAVDPMRNVIVCGSATVGASPGFYTVKYNPNGTKLWERYYGLTSGEARGVATDFASNIIVTGVSVLRDPDFFTLKYDSSGNLLWAKREDWGRSDSARGIAVDGHGNIFVAGSVFNTERQNSDFAVLKYSPLGQLLWKRTYDSGGEDRVTNMAADRSGFIAVTGSTKKSGQLADFLTVKFDTEGRILWSQSTNGGVDETPNDVALDSLGRVIVVGLSKQSSSSDGFAVAYSAQGEQLWMVRQDVAAQESLNGVALDSQSRLILVGYAGSDYRITQWRNGFAPLGEYRSPVPNFEQKILLTELRAHAALFRQKITAIVETSNSDFGPILESAKIDLQDGLRSYPLDFSRPTQYVRVRFLFQTSDSRVTPELYQFSLHRAISNP
jgi:uncharacterized delta-60 repeat protein